MKTNTRWFILPAVLALGLMMAAYAGCSSSSTAATGTFTLSPSTITVAPGATGTTTLTLGSTASSAVSIVTSNAPSGMTVTVSPTSTQKTATITVAVDITGVAGPATAPDAGPNAYGVDIYAVGPGYSSAITLTVIVPPAASEFTFGVSPETVSIAATKSAPITLTTVRAAGFTGPITVTFAPPVGMVVNPPSLTMTAAANTATASIVLSASAVIGQTYTVVATASVGGSDAGTASSDAGGASQSVSIAVTVLGFPGEIDPTYSGDVPIATLASAVQPADGKLVIAGFDSTVTSNVALARLNTNGSIDTTFGTTNGVGANNVVYTPVGYALTTARCVAIQPADGKILIAANGSASGANYLFVGRYTTTGALDTTYGTAQTGFVSNPDTTLLASMGIGCALDGTGNLVVVTSQTVGTTARAFAVLRYTPAGILDTTFGSAGTGKTTIPFGGITETGNQITMQPDSGILVGGTSIADGGSVTNFAVGRLTYGGAPDLTFGPLSDAGQGTGAEVISFYNLNDSANALLYSNGKIVIGGVSVGATYLPAILQLTSSGLLDSTFNGSGPGKATLVTGANYSIASSTQLSVDGHIYVGGTTSNGTSGLPYIARLTPAGALDTVFGSAGILYIPEANASTIATLPNGVFYTSPTTIQFDATGNLLTTVVTRSPIDSRNHTLPFRIYH